MQGLRAAYIEFTNALEKAELTNSATIPQLQQKQVVGESTARPAAGALQLSEALESPADTPAETQDEEQSVHLEQPIPDPASKYAGLVEWPEECGTGLHRPPEDSAFAIYNAEIINPDPKINQEEKELLGDEEKIDMARLYQAAGGLYCKGMRLFQEVHPLTVWKVYHPAYQPGKKFQQDKQTLLPDDPIPYSLPRAGYIRVATYHFLQMISAIVVSCFLFQCSCQVAPGRGF